MKRLPNTRNFFHSHRVLRFFVFLVLFLVIAVAAAGALTFGGLTVVCRPSAAVSSLAAAKAPSSLAAAVTRPEVSTYLTYPEWFIVYSSDEYAQFLAHHNPSQFPYFGSIGQYWSNYCKVFAITKARGEFNGGDHLMLLVIGWSYSAELGLKGVYENTIGRITELFGAYPATQEDVYADTIAQDYVQFIRLRPWYEYNFAQAFGNLWTHNNFFGKHFVRKIERRLFLSAEYGVKTVYGFLIGVGSHSVYGVESTETYAVVRNANDTLFTAHPEIKKVQQFGPGAYSVSVPRYQPFTDLVPDLAARGVQFVDIAGNKEIFLTVLINRNIAYRPSAGEVVFESGILTDPSKKRMALSVPVASLSEVLQQVSAGRGLVEHVYDY